MGSVDWRVVLTSLPEGRKSENSGKEVDLSFLAPRLCS